MLTVVEIGAQQTLRAVEQLDCTVRSVGDALRHHEAPAAVPRDSYDRTTEVVGRIPRIVEPLPGRLP
jgi:hypothetical protein